MAPIVLNNSPSAPSWFTPKRLLIILCVINMLNYVDRGAIASNGVNGSIETCDSTGICTSGTGIQGDFNLDNFQDGILSSAFMVGLLVASPIFASLAKSHNPFRLVGFGLSIWTFATAGCGCSVDFWSVTFCRMLVGVGEASFISLAAPFIDDHAPAAQKTSWLAAFYMCIPTGVALGYIYGGFVGNHFNWRYAFWVESLLMLPFAVLGFVMKPLQMRGFSLDPSNKALTSTESASGTEGFDGQAVMPSKLTDSTTKLHQLSHYLKDVKMLLLHKVFITNVLGYASYTFVIGAYSYWGPKAGYSIYHMTNADLMFGGVTIVCGIFGTLGGGLILDRMNATISNAFKLLFGATFVGTIFCFSAFCLSNMYGFLFLFAVGELFVFATQAPVNYVCLHCVKPGMRPLSMAVSTISIHVLGDVPSSPLVGILEDHINNWRITSLILTSVLFLAAGIWFIGGFLESEDMSEDTSGNAEDGMEPLLYENERVENA